MSKETLTVMMPRELTAENGAKGLMSGEFHEVVTDDCPYCDATGYLDVDEEIECDCCNGAGHIERKVTVGWDTIKEIYAMAVKHLGE